MVLVILDPLSEIAQASSDPQCIGYQYFYKGNKTFQKVDVRQLYTSTTASIPNVWDTNTFTKATKPFKWQQIGDSRIQTHYDLQRINIVKKMNLDFKDFKSHDKENQQTTFLTRNLKKKVMESKMAF